MKQKFFSRKAQAMMEMAILAPIVVMAVGIVVTYAAKLNGDQYQLMQAFRRALMKSHNDNKAVAYGTWDDRRQADASNPIVGHKVTSSGSGAVMWAIPSVEDKGEDPEKTLWMGINSTGGRFGQPIEYDLGEEASSGAITPMYVTTTTVNVSVNRNDGQVSSNRSAGVAEFMTYKIDKTRYPQGRASGASR
ncbi:MAG: hypothetical protein M0R48_03855 [Candidatus Omnitrophica bacterium]|jgi:hypothetical protein|nr:hypothetical protein [Candidatus Omnitrophota bacterium]